MLDLPPDSLPPYEQIIEHRLVQCGLNSNGFTVKYADNLQSFEIVISPSAGATSDNFACISDAAGNEIVTFEDGAMHATYVQSVTELARPERIQRYEDRLKELGLWEHFPAREDFGSLKEYAEALELHAGLEAGSALRVLGDGVVFDPSSNSLNLSNFTERFSTLLTVIAYAATRDRMPFGFIGNEKVAE